MTAYFADTNSIGPGPCFVFGASGESYTILPGVTVASTNFEATISGDYFSAISIFVLGTLAGEAVVGALGDTVAFMVGATGQIVSENASFLLSFDGMNCVFSNSGTILGPNAVAITSVGLGFVGTNLGTISASTPVILGLYGLPGHRFTNDGHIVARTNSSASTLLGNGIFSEGPDTRVENLAGGTIVAVDDEGAGVRFGSLTSGYSVTGSSFVNAGEVTSLRWWGVDYGEAPAGTLTLVNSGVIRGEAGAFRGHAGVDLVTNSGRMEGNVELGAGADVFLNPGGMVLGDIALGAGNDLYDGRGASDVLGTVSGGAGNDTLTGGQADDRLSGGNQNDDLKGGAGDDTLLGDAGNDTQHGGQGDDWVSGGAGDDRLLGGAGDDPVEGGAGGDTIRGGAGDDTVVGGADADQMTGGQGADLFLFASVAEIGLTAGARDRITDFRKGEDVIDLSAIDADTTLAGDQAFAFVAGNFTGVAGQLRYAGATGLVQGDVNGDGTADFSLELAPGLGLTAADFVL